MALYDTIFAKYGRQAARSAVPTTRLLDEVTGSEQLGEIAREKRDRGLLESIFGYLDLPGSAIRHLLTGDIGGTAESIGAFLLPGIVDQPEDRPDFGLLGNLATDPLIWFTGGGAGALAGVKAATRVGGRVLTRSKDIARFGGAALGKNLVRGGRQFLKQATDKEVRSFLQTRIARKGLTTNVDDLLKGMGQKRSRQLYRSMEQDILGQTATKLVDPRAAVRRTSALEFAEMVKAGTGVKTGGVRMGLPFTYGKTVAGKGKHVNLLAASPYYWIGKGAAKQAMKIPGVEKAMLTTQAGAIKLLQKFYPGFGMTAAGKHLYAGRGNMAHYLEGHHHSQLNEIFRGWEDDALEDFTQVVKGTDFKGNGIVDEAGFLAKHKKFAEMVGEGDEAQTLFTRTLNRYDTWMKQRLKEMVDRGILLPEVPYATRLRRFEHYFPEEGMAIREENARRATKGLPEKRWWEDPDFEVEVFDKQVLEEYEHVGEAVNRKKMIKDDPVAALGLQPGELGKEEIAELAKSIALRRVPGRPMKFQITKRDPGKVVSYPHKLQQQIPEDLAYIPQQLNEKGLGKLELLNLRQFLDNTSPVYRIKGSKGPYGARTSTVFTKERQFTQDEFLDWGTELTGEPIKNVQELNAFGLATRYSRSHSRMIANYEMMQEAKRIFETPHQTAIFPFLQKADGTMDEIAARYDLAGWLYSDEAMAMKKARNLIIRETEDGLHVLEKSAMIERDTAFAQWVKEGAGHLKPQGPFMNLLDAWNKKLFKPFVTVGFGVFPNTAFVARNVMSGVWQVGSHENIGAVSGLKHVWEIINGGMARAVEAIPGMGKFPRTQLNTILKHLDDTKQLADDVMVKGTPYSEREFGELLLKGGLSRQSFSEAELTKLLSAAPHKRSFAEWAKALTYSTEFPTEINRGVELRMRATALKHALGKGLRDNDALQAVNDALINYDYVSNWHRNLRQVVPFAQFTLGQTPRTIKTILERPKVLSPLMAAGLGTRTTEEMLPEWVGEQPHFKLPMEDAEGNPIYVAGLGSPFEDIGKFWAGSPGRTIEKTIAQTHPLMKLTYEAASKREPFFGSEYGSYRRDTPFAQMFPDWMTGRRRRTIAKGKAGEKEISEVAPIFLKTLQYLPISRQISIFNQLWDTRRPTWTKTISLLTGGKVVSVDDEKQIKRVIGQYLKGKAQEGQIGIFQKFFAYGDIDPELAALIKTYYASTKEGGARPVAGPKVKK